MASEPIIALRNVTKTYGSGATAFQALKGIDLKVEQGDFMAVMGPSGSGKSTAMNILGCLDVPSSGSYLFKGVPVEGLSRDERALLRRRYLGFVFRASTCSPAPMRSKMSSCRCSIAARTSRSGAPARWRRSAESASPTGGPYAGRTLRRPATAGGDRPGDRHRAQIAARRQADRQSRQQDLGRDHGPLTDLNRNSGITVLMVTHEPAMAAYSPGTHRPLPRRAGRRRSIMG